MSFLNISGYCFHRLEDLPSLKEAILKAHETLNLKGTILLAPEGINLFISGPEEDCQSLINSICALIGIGPERLDMKYSFSEKHAFSRFLVRLKKEIIAFDYLYHPEHTAPYISPKELHQALCEQPEDIIVLDTRNTYETELGAFKNAIIPPIASFKEFKDFAQEHINEWKDKKIVTYCTGGIRCEKAATFLKDLGCPDVVQLHGGILRYFEDVGGDFYEGECFVFDKRVSLKSDLSIGDKTLCYACRQPLCPQDCLDPAYKPGESCSYCIEK